MKTLKLLNYAAGQWVAGEGALEPVLSAVTGEPVAETGARGLDYPAMLEHARKVGGPALGEIDRHLALDDVVAGARAVSTPRE